MSAMSAETQAQPVVAELLGTLALVFFGAGAAVVAGEFIGSLGIALTFGFILLALGYAIGPVSGSHINPALTLGVLLAGRMSLRLAVSYWIAQCVGAVIGAALLFLVARQVPGLETAGAFGSNGYGYRSAVGISVLGALVAEVMMTALLVFVALAVTRRLSVRGLYAVPTGLAFALVHLMGVPLTGTSVNPARSLGPALFAGGEALLQLWLFLLAPLTGAVLAVAVHRLVHPQPGAWLPRVPVWPPHRLTGAGGVAADAPPGPGEPGGGSPGRGEAV